MWEWLKTQWDDIKGNVKYALLVLILAGASLLTAGLKWWQRALLAILFATLTIWATVATARAKSRKASAHPGGGNLGGLPSGSSKENWTNLPLPTDPRLYLEVVERGTGMGRCTPFVLSNKGGDVAHAIAIKPVSLHRGRVTFGSIDFIGVATTAELLPEIANAGVFSRNDIIPLLLEEWNTNTANGIQEEVSMPIEITYKDYCENNEFTTSLQIVLFPIRQSLKEHHQHSWPEDRRT